MGPVQNQILEGNSGSSGPNMSKPISTVLIGLGGSGKEVLMRLRKRFHDRYVTKDPGYVKFVFIDTDAQTFVPQNKQVDAFISVYPEEDEKVVCPINKDQYEQTFRKLADKNESDHLDWLKLDLRTIGHKSLEHGAGTHRQFGRLAFFLNYLAIRRTTEEQIKRVLRYASANATEVESDRIEVVIVTSLAGGTGSGMFIDAAYMVRDILNRPDYLRLLGKSITLIAYLPEMFKDKPSELPKKRQNAYAALLELEHYGTPRTGDEVFVGKLPHGLGGSRGTRFSARWDGSTPTKVDGPGWDTCFLVDDVNNLNAASPLPLDEIYQMTADYLFLDFERHEFASAKRSTRANLVQFMERRKETWVKRLSDGQDGTSGAFSATDVIYATQNGCRYSTFGLAEVYFDVERLYQAAGYRLAYHLIRTQWLGKANAHGESRYREWARADLLHAEAAQDQPRPQSFLFDALSHQMYLRNGVSSREVARRRLAELAKLAPKDGLTALLKEFDENGRMLGRATDGRRGAARATLVENRRVLEGDPTTLGPLRERLLAVSGNRLSRHGVRTLIELLKYYRSTLNEERKVAAAAVAAPPASEAAILASLTECELIPNPMRKIAQGILYPAALASTAASIDAAYRKAAGEEVEPLYQGLNRFIGAADQQDYPELNRHGTLHNYFSRVQTVFESMETRLDERFKQSSREDEKHETRRFSLSVGWDSQEYDKRINTALVVNPNIGSASQVGPGEGGGAGSGFHWRNLESQVLIRLRQIGVDLEDVRDLSSLIRSWMSGPFVDAEGVNDVCELLAEACRFVLRKTDRGGGLPFTEAEGNGNVVDFLSRGTELRAKAENMVKASDVYFPTIDRGQVADGFRPAYFNLYGQKPAEDAKNKEKNDKRVADMVREIAEHRGQRDESGILPEKFLASDVSSLVLAREMTGFPLQFYSRLGELKRYYETNTTHSGSNDECHIDYNESSQDLPDISILDPQTYTDIRNSVGYVIRGLIIGLIQYKQGALHVSVSDRFQVNSVDIRLGNRLYGTIKTACEKVTVRDHLESKWASWAARAEALDWFAVYVSSLKTYKEIQPIVDAQKREVRSSPLRNCFEEIVDQSIRELKKTADGKIWLEGVSPADPADDVLPNGINPGKDLAAKIESECLRRLNDELPIYQLVLNNLNKLRTIDPTLNPQGATPA